MRSEGKTEKEACLGLVDLDGNNLAYWVEAGNEYSPKVYMKEQKN